MIIFYTIAGFFLLYVLIGVIAVRLINRSAGIKRKLSKKEKKEKKEINNLLDEILK